MKKLTGPAPKHPFSRKLREKGYTLSEAATIWELRPRRMSIIAAKPRNIDWLALKALPKKK